MAVEYISSESFTQGVSGSHSITVPTDCTMMIVVTGGYEYNNGNSAVTAMNLDGSGLDFTFIGTTYYDTTGDPATGVNDSGNALYVLSPATGSRTLSITMEGATEGWSIIVIYLKGENQSDPIGDVDLTDDYDPGGTSADVSLTGVETGDMSFGYFYSWQTTPNVDPAGSGQSVIAETIYNDAGCGVCYKASASNIEADSLSSPQWVVWAVNAATGGAASKVGSTIFNPPVFGGILVS
jgi:hypothetical protein